MKLPFRLQFLLTPIVVVLILAGLVAYTLWELAEIKRGNNELRHWVVASDRIQTILATSHLLHEDIQALNATPEPEDGFFDFLEHAAVLRDNLAEADLLVLLPPDLVEMIQANREILREPQRGDPQQLAAFLTAIVPAFEYQDKIVRAQRRSTFIDNHKALQSANKRMTMVSLTTLVICMLIAGVLGYLSLRSLRRRLTQISQRVLALPAPPAATGNSGKIASDEIEGLETYLSRLTEQLIHAVSLRNVLRGAENERKRIAMEMHDGVLADLTYVNREIDRLKKLAVTDSAVLTPNLDKLRNEIDACLVNLRRSIEDLHPQALETLGLECAIQSFMQRQMHGSGDGSTQSDYHLEYDSQVEPLLSMDIKICVFRIVSEAVHNAIKHARGDRLEVSIRRIADHIVATVEDNGIGMNGSNPEGHGCTNILERARLIGAAAQWKHSRFASGTCFQLNIPVEAV